MRKTTTSPLSLVLIAGTLACAASAGLSAGGCKGSPEAAAGGQTESADAAAPFQPVPPTVYVAKVKNILVGLPPTDAEIATVTADPTQLKTLIDGWMALPEYTAKMKVFFELAFQQTQVSIADFADQAYPKQADINATTTPLIVQNAIESFSRTVLALNAQGSPLNDAMTTTSFMMTPALMELYAFLDAWQVDDASVVSDRFKAANPTTTITVEASAGPIPIAETLDPTSANYMHWYDPDVTKYAANAPTGCGGDPIVYPASAATLHYLLQGSLDGRKGTGGVTCPPSGGTAAAPQLTASDYTTWSMVTVRPPNPGESPTAFYDLPALRSATELVLTIPRVGFFSTPAFFANWQTNTSNTMRVTTNQALIVATGASIDGTDTTTPATTPGLDAAHAGPGPCFHCHQLLDPTRSIFAATYSWNYHDQTDPTYSGQLGLFAFEGVIKPVASMADFGATIGSHPLFAQAWVQKLAYYVNSGACETTDPEFQRIVGVFQSAGYSWNALVRELLSSPLTTYATPTQTVNDNGEVVAVARRDHLCAALNARLGFADICGLDATTKAAATTTIPEIVSGLPSDGYGRGAVAPVLPNQPTLFYRAGTENICEAASALVIDPATATTGVTTWSSAQPTAAIADFVSLVMGLGSSDPRAAPANTLLTSHFTAAVQEGATATNALRSTFIAACLAPSAVSIGL